MVRRAVFFSTFLILIGADARAQTVPDRRACPECSIRSELVATLGSSDGPAALNNVWRVSADSRGRYWVFGTPMLPKLFDPTGRFIRTVGAYGGGPGEFEAPYDLIQVPGDTVIVMDGASKMHVLDPALRYVRTLHSPVMVPSASIVQEWPSAVLLNAVDLTEERFGIPFHVIDFSDPAAQVRQSFGGTNDPIKPSNLEQRLRYSLYPARNGGYWAMALGRYAITKWSSTNQREFVLERRPRWFSGPSDMLDGGPRTPPSPRCAGASEDGNGLVWTFCLIPSTNWKAAWRRVENRLGPESGMVDVPSSEIDSHLLYHTRIEVIDPRTRRVVTTHTIDHPVTSVLSQRRVAVVVFSEIGIPTVRIIRFNLFGYDEERR